MKHETKTIRRAQIMEAAGKLIVRRGSEHITVKGIAAEVGISEAAIYRHFRSKKDILLLLVDYIGDTLVNDIEDAAFRESNSLVTLEVALNKHISAIERRHGISFQVISEIISLGDKALNKRAYEVLGKYATRLELVLDQAVKQGVVRETLEIEPTARLISSMVQGLVNTWVLSNYSINLNDAFKEMWNVVFEGIAARHIQG
jgi:AcrR family transcriptional regulator